VRLVVPYVYVYFLLKNWCLNFWFVHW